MICRDCGFLFHPFVAHSISSFCRFIPFTKFCKFSVIITLNTLPDLLSFTSASGILIIPMLDLLVLSYRFLRLCFFVCLFFLCYLGCVNSTDMSSSSQIIFCHLHWIFSSCKTFFFSVILFFTSIITILSLYITYSFGKIFYFLCFKTIYNF